MTEEFRLRCPKCNKLRKGFVHTGKFCFLTGEFVTFTIQCNECGREFFAEYKLIEIREKPEINP